ncbi:MAG: HAMP domain-containing histidine kinase [Candidatus Gastranaerophilales bacterium]|nr:HAMP domain-containing histidine kinase [Candidatus Gastranaerophilales bacterium]
MDNLCKSLNLVNELIDLSDFKTDKIYDNAVLKLLSAFDNLKYKSCAVFFAESSDFILKSAFNDKKAVSEYKINFEYPNKLLSSKQKYLFFETKNDELLYENTILIKLEIRGSVFGFILFSSSDKLNDFEIAQLCALSSVISYKIKDYELSEVFKIQLKAMQDAVLEKENAYSVVKKQHKKLQELDKTKNPFLANISHDLRTPLNAIIGFSQALDSKIFGELNDKQSEYVKDIQISGLHLLGMINEILDLSKLEAHAMKFTPSEINIHQTIQEVVNILEPLYKDKNIEINFISKYNSLIFADYQKIQQILYNLLSNAIKFTPQNGKITIESYAEGKNYYLNISDTGVGIDKKFHNKIFKKFVHLNNVYVKNQASTGLGLTITKELVKLHNGKISLESELNKGTTFKIEFKNILV